MIDCPSAAGDRANSRSQNSSLITTTASLPAVSSNGRIVATDLRPDAEHVVVVARDFVREHALRVFADRRIHRRRVERQQIAEHRDSARATARRRDTRSRRPSR